MSPLQVMLNRQVISLFSGMTESLPWLDALRDLVLGEPSADTVACHAPKPILLSTGEVRNKTPSGGNGTNDIQTLMSCFMYYSFILDNFKHRIARCFLAAN